MQNAVRAHLLLHPSSHLEKYPRRLPSEASSASRQTPWDLASTPGGPPQRLPWNASAAPPPGIRSGKPPRGQAAPAAEWPSPTLGRPPSAPLWKGLLAAPAPHTRTHGRGEDSPSSAGEHAAVRRRRHPCAARSPASLAGFGTSSPTRPQLDRRTPHPPVSPAAPRRTRAVLPVAEAQKPLSDSGLGA
eukprot:scaffold977_cov253-Pinguiococcus_pyrenoidosus.AAC.42